MRNFSGEELLRIVDAISGVCQATKALELALDKLRVEISSPSHLVPEFSTRAHNCFLMNNVPFVAGEILKCDRPNTMPGFGIKCFAETCQELISCRVSKEEIQGSVFWKSSPAKWRRVVELKLDEWKRRAAGED